MDNLIIFLLIIALLYVYTSKSNYVLPSYRYIDTENEVALTRPYTSGRISEIFTYCSPESWQDCDYEKRMALNVGGIPNIPH